MRPAVSLSMTSIIWACFLCGCAFGQFIVQGPLDFALQRDGTDTYLNKKGDVCAPQFRLLSGTFKVGAIPYSSIYVCENGYLMPAVLEIEGPPRQWENGNDFSNPTSTMIAVALLNNTRIDNWLDRGCNANVFGKPWYIFEPVCEVYKSAVDRLNGETNTEDLQDIPYAFEPIAGPGATRANIINDFKNGVVNVANYYALIQYPFEIGQQFRYSVFSHTPQEVFELGAENNVIARALVEDELFLVGLISDPTFTFQPDWGFCVSWYKVSQPPEIVDRQNTFQIVMACRSESFELGISGTCYTLFDYFELMFVENDGVFMRAGIAGPNIRKKYLINPSTLVQTFIQPMIRICPDFAI